MATLAEFIQAMEVLLAAYPGYAASRGLPMGDYHFLLDIPGDLLSAAARVHIRKRAWFPRISELRLEAARLAGVMIFDEGQPAALSERQLFGMDLQLRAEFNRGEGLDERTWKMLIEAYERIGNVEWANGARSRLAYYRRREEGER